MEALESDSSTSQGEHSSSGSPSEEDVNTRGHHFGRTTINSGQAHLGDSFYVTNNIYPSPAVSHENLRLPTAPHGRRPSSSSRSRSRERRSKWMVPRPSSSYFTGRRLQLEQLRSNLLPPSSQEVAGRKVVVVLGLGGSGKTQFCLKFAEQCKEEFVPAKPIFKLVLT